jgi:hypothetical protein
MAASVGKLEAARREASNCRCRLSSIKRADFTFQVLNLTRASSDERAVLRPKRRSSDVRPHPNRPYRSRANADARYRSCAQLAVCGKLHLFEGGRPARQEECQKCGSPLFVPESASQQIRSSSLAW